MTSVVCPGDRLRHSSEASAGHGTHVRADGCICASLAGSAVVTPPATSGALPTVEVHHGGGSGGGALPHPGSLVLARVMRVTPRQATCDLLCVDGRPVAERAFAGVVRQQDVRATEVDRVVLHDCFRAGDVLRARVLSLGDARAYHLSTAANDLGCVHARCGTSGEPLEALSWLEMRSPATGASEPRKVART